MAPTAPALAQSDSKARFMMRIGLDESNKMHRYLYSLMKTEAVEGWTRMTANREALLPELKHDLKVEPPYTFSQLDEGAVHNEVLHIYRNARPETKIMYGLGHDREGDYEENWIIRWLLWHVFRYRDDRNSGPNRKGRQVTTPAIALDDDNVSDDISDSIDEASGVIAATTATQHAGESGSFVPFHRTNPAEHVAPSRFWDPIREEFRS